LILTDKNDKEVIFPYGSEAQQSCERGIKLLADLYQLAERKIRKEAAEGTKIGKSNRRNRKKDFPTGN
jgi:hypothetical protein